MKLQSSIEFLTTYSFLFLLIGIVLSFLFFFSSAPRSTIPGQCISGGGVYCSSVEDYVNFTKHYSLFTFSFTNSQSVPINVLSMQVYINNANSIASGCIPTVEYPGGVFTCVAAMVQTPSIGSTVSGYYTVNTLYCNSGISSLQNNCTTGNNIQYSGSFTTPASSTKPLLFSVLTLLGPQNQQISTFQTNPQALPSGYTRIQNGGWSTVTSSYGFGSNAYQNQNFIGVQIAPFSLSTSALGTNSVSCAGNYNSILSMAYSIVYLPPQTTGTGGVSVYANNAIEFYYSGSGLSWSNLLGGAAWHSNQIPTQYGPYSIPFSSGINYLAVLWSHDCGPGVQAINVAGLPGSASTTSSTSTSSTSTTSTSTTSTTTSTSTTSTSTSTSTTSTSTTSTTSTIEYIYCVSGVNNGADSTNVYYAPLLTNGGVGAWTSTNSYGVATDSHSCVTYGGYVYCSGGGTTASYSARMTTGGTTSWTSTTAVPASSYDSAIHCVSYNGYMYCIQGDQSGGCSAGLDFYATVSGGTIGSWSSTTSYPFCDYSATCVNNGGTVYCTTGTTFPYPTYVGYTYGATLSSGGIGAWATGATNPANGPYGSCVYYGGYIYCIGGYPGASTAAVEYASVTGTTVNSWASTNAYPLNIYANSCVVYNGYVDCVGGYTGSTSITNVYYASLFSGAISTWTSSNAYPTNVYAQSCVTGPT